MYNYSNYPINPTQYVQNNQNDRLIGGFAFPFLLGGVTGAALAPSFWGPGYGYNRPPYPPYYAPGFGPRPYPYR